MPTRTGLVMMAKRKRRSIPAEPLAVYRPVAWSAVVGTAFAVMLGAPAHSDPTTTPDTGTRPAPSGQLRLPGAAPAAVLPPAVAGPLRDKIMAEEIAVAALGEQRNALDVEVAAKRATVTETERIWQAALDELNRLRAAVDAAAADAYKDATVLAPFREIGPDLRGLGRLMPRAEEPTITPWDLARAEAEERSTFRVHSDALLAEQGVSAQYADLDAKFRKREADLIKFRQDNAAQVALIEAEQEALARAEAGRLPIPGRNASGLEADVRAIEAVKEAIRQEGKPYEWGAEGPSRFDCSGLMWWSYKHVGVTLQRVAKDQYHTTTPVTRDMLLPGDLIFFGNPLDGWQGIYHVGMYVGNNVMVNAPRSGDHVRRVPIMWSRVYGVTRVLQAHVVTPTPTTTPPTTPPPPATTTPPPATVGPTTPPPTTTTPPPATVEPTTPPPTTPSPTPSPTPTPAATEPSSAPSGAASPSPT